MWRNSNLDVIDPRCGDCGNSVHDLLRRPMHRTRRGTDRLAPGDGPANVRGDLNIERTKRAFSRIFQIDDVNAASANRFRLGWVSHARKHQCHRRLSSSIRWTFITSGWPAGREI